MSCSVESLKKQLENAVMVTIDTSVPLVIETDASDIATAATFNQHHRPVVSFSRKLTPVERRYFPIK